MKLYYTDKTLGFIDGLRSNYPIKPNPVRQIAIMALIISLIALPIVISLCGFLAFISGIGLPALPYLVLGMTAVPLFFAAIAFSPQLATASLQLATLLFATPTTFIVDCFIMLKNKASHLLNPNKKLEQQPESIAKSDMYAQEMKDIPRQIIQAAPQQVGIESNYGNNTQGKVISIFNAKSEEIKREPTISTTANCIINTKS